MIVRSSTTLIMVFVAALTAIAFSAAASGVDVAFADGLNVARLQELRGLGWLLQPSISITEIVGFVAGFGTTFAAMPDLIAMLRRRSSAGMNPRMATIMGAFQVVWVYYGLLIDSPPVIVWNVIGVLTNALVVGAFFHFRRAAKRSSIGDRG